MTMENRNVEVNADSAKVKRKEFVATLCPDRVQQAVDGIWSGFDWETSPQGREYWMKVVDELEQIAQGVQGMETFDAAE